MFFNDTATTEIYTLSLHDALPISIRKIETLVKFWEVEPHMELLTDREDNEAYLTAAEGEKYVVLFPEGGTVKLDLSRYNRKFTCRWISIKTGEWGEQFFINGGNKQEISTPDSGGWFVVITEIEK